MEERTEEVQLPVSYNNLMWAAAVPVSPNSLTDASTMRFEALSSSTGAPGLVQGPVAAVATETVEFGELGDKVSEFLRSSGTVTDDCFAFDFGSVMDTCSNDI